MSLNPVFLQKLKAMVANVTYLTTEKQLMELLIAANNLLLKWKVIAFLVHFTI